MTQDNYQSTFLINEPVCDAFLIIDSLQVWPTINVQSGAKQRVNEQEIGHISLRYQSVYINIYIYSICWMRAIMISICDYCLPGGQLRAKHIHRQGTAPFPIGIENGQKKKNIDMNNVFRMIGKLWNNCIWLIYPQLTKLCNGA